MMKAGNAIGMEAPGGRLVASALALPYGNSFGWISMVLVTADWRKKGLATRLLQSCIEQLESSGLTPVLDATPAGENVYRPLGFLPHFGFQRWEHDAVETVNVQTQPHDDVTVDDISWIDGQVFGGARPAVLESLTARSSRFSCSDKTSDGYLLGRDGRVASQIGPIFTSDTASALIMLDHALAKLRGRVFIDACDHQSEFITRLKQYGFKPQRPFLRMAKDRKECFGDPAKMFAMAGPELG